MGDLPLIKRHAQEKATSTPHWYDIMYILYSPFKIYDARRFTYQAKKGEQ